MIGRTTAVVFAVLVSAAGTARADGVGWEPGSFDGILAVMAILGILGVCVLYQLVKNLFVVRPVEERPPAIAAARVHRETSPSK